MKKIFLLIILWFIPQVFAAVSDQLSLIKNSSLNLTAEEKLWLQNHPNIRFTGDPNWLPFEAFDKQGKYIGIVAEHLALIEEKIGIKFKKIVTKTWTESVGLARSGAVEVLSETDDSALKSHLLFSDNYVTNPVVIVMNIRQNYVENLTEIKSKKIGVIRDYGYVTKIIDKYQQHQFVVVENIQDGLIAVSTGKVDALLCTVTLCGYTISQLSLHDVKIVGKTEFDTKLAFGVNKQFPLLVSILNKAIANISEKQHQQILDHWVIQDYVEKTDIVLVLNLVLFSALVIAFLIYRQFQLRRYNKKLRLSEKRYVRVVSGTSDGIWDWNIKSNEQYFSPKFESLLGYPEGSFDNNPDPFFKLVHPDTLSKLKNTLDKHLIDNTTYDMEVQLKHKSGKYRWYQTSGQAEWNELGEATRMSGALTDIHARKQAESLDKSRSAVLEIIAQGDTFEKTLEAIIASIELQNPGMIGSILLMDESGKRLLKGAAPSLPEFYNDAINGGQIGAAVGSCGSAAALGKRVIVEDIQTHPNWSLYRELASKADLAACWSEPIFDLQGKVAGTFAIYHREVTRPEENDFRLIEQAANLAAIAIEKHRSNEELQLASLVYQNSSEAMLIFDSERNIISVNPAFTKITGYRAEEMLGHKADILNSEYHDKDFYAAMRQQVLETGFWQGEVKDRRKNGEMFVKWLIVNTIFNDDGSVHRRLALFSDITEKRKSEELIWKQANFDFLTGLPNRNMFHERLEREIKQAKRDSLSFALLLIDLDHFKEVNDTLGHDVGDILLVEAASRISLVVRETDTVARLGGDEFCIIMSEIDEVSNIERVAQQVLDKLSEPFYLGNEVSFISASVGITIFPTDAEEFDLLLKNADQAMYQSKSLGRSRYQYFTASMQQAAQHRMLLIAELRQAIKQKQFTLVYQPIVKLVNNEVHKAEALIRWLHPQKGLMSPADFIPVAEETGMIVIIGDWVLQQAAHQVSRWRSKFVNHFQISVNTSPVQYQANGFDFKGWSNQLKALNLSGEAIVIEITESLMMDSTELVRELLLDFRNSRIQVALDDFGTGYSSLSYLKKFDIDYIKIDQSFVKNLEKDKDNRALCEAIVVMAHKLNLKVIAEGVETEEQREILLNMGCDYAQGYLFAKPLEGVEFEKLFLN